MTHRLFKGATPVKRVDNTKENYWRPEQVDKPAEFVRTESRDKIARMALDECMEIIKKSSRKGGQENCKSF